MKFSIIIPTLNEAGTIQDCLSALQPLRSRCELIVADGGSTDSTKTLAAPLADKVTVSSKGRARQMNNGAQQATGDVLIFLHADTRLPENALNLIEQSLKEPRIKSFDKLRTNGKSLIPFVVSLSNHEWNQLVQRLLNVNGKAQWGRFDIQLTGRHFMLKVVAFMMTRRSRLTGIATGDQVIFVTRQAFENAGHYPEIALMEDIALCKALKRISKPINLKAKVTSSGRRWEQFGVYKTILLMWSLRLRYFFGANPQLLAQLYARGKFWKP